MNKIVKGLVSEITLLSMLAIFAMGFPNIADADNDIENQVSSNRNLSVDFLGRGATPSDTSSGKANLTSEDKGKEFWVGVSVDKVNDLELFTDGVYSVDLAFEYNPTYIKPYWDTTSEQSWNDELIKGNLTDSQLADTSAWWGESQYEIVSVSEADIDLDLNDRENSTEAAKRAEAGWRMCYVGVLFKGDSFDSARFKSLESDGKQYLLKLPFVLVSTPEDNESTDLNPTVLSLIKGRDTFAIGSGSDGTNPHASWFATTNPSPDDTNLKNLFDFTGDISLFASNETITDIVAVKSVTSDDDDGTIDLSSTKDLERDGFKAETQTYYVSVSNEVDKLSLDITSSEKPTVTVNDKDVSVTYSGDKKYSTAEFDIAELNSKDDDYNNVAYVSVGNTKYTIYIRRLLKPKIVLNYGNSPYGEIMNADNIAPEDKQAAKDEFNVGNKFTSKYCPTECNSSIVYVPYAWNTDKDSKTIPVSSDINMDRNDYAIFIYNKEEFVDPGFTAYDSVGNQVPYKDVTRQMTLKVMSGLGAANAKDSAVTEDDSIINVPGEISQYRFTKLSDKLIRPDIYDLNYSFTDPVTGEKETFTRKVVLLWELGDADFSAVFNGGDATEMNKIVKGISKPLDGITGVTTCLYYYRILDIDRSKVFNGGDATETNKVVKGISTKAPIYNSLN